MAEQKVRLFVDMDGTLVQFRKDAELEELYRPSYFLSLKPHDCVVKAMNLLCNEVDVYILSAVLSDSATAKKEKNTWLNQYVPQIDEAHRIFLPCGKKKTAYVPSGVGMNDFLLDDYTLNLNDWSKEGGQGIKLLNEINHTHGSWEGSNVRFNQNPVQLAFDLLAILRHGALIQEEPKHNLNHLSKDMHDIGYEPIQVNDIGEDVLLWKEGHTNRIIGLDGMQSVNDFLEDKRNQFHDGFEIIQTINTGIEWYALGRNIHSSNYYATWLCSKDKMHYFCPHYFRDRLAAEQDILRCALENIERYNQIQRKRIKEIKGEGKWGRNAISSALKSLSAPAMELEL